MVCKYLINLKIGDDKTCAAALLHDVIEDNAEVSKETLVTTYKLKVEVYDIVEILTKPKGYKQIENGEKKYYERIKLNKRALAIKLSDRANNLSTVDAFTKEKMIDYVNETKIFYYELCRYGKAYFPEYSNAITIMKYQIQSICESIEALFNIKVLESDPLKYRKTFIFIRDYSINKGLKNTAKAVFIANNLHKGDVRKTGDPFIIHPLRVCSYLIALRINDDIACASSLLHETLSRGKLPRGGIELTEDYKLDPKISEVITLLTRSNDVSNEQYYSNLKTNIIAILVKLSNKAHTCTRLSTYTDTQKEAYIVETRTFIDDLCNFAQENYPEYWDQIEIMKYHIFSICKIVEAIMKVKKDEK